MKRLFFVCVLGLLSVCLAGNNVELSLTATTDKPDAIYQIGERAVFSFEANATGDIKYKLTFDGVSAVDTAEGFKVETVTATDGSVKTIANLSATLDRPGFLRCTFSIKPDGEENISYVAAAAAYEPLKIEAAAVIPDDFDEFWDRIKYNLSCIPLNAHKTSVNKTDKFETFDVEADSIGMPMRGYYSKPVDAKKGGCPAILFVHGAGVRSSNMGAIQKYAEEGFIALDINAHGIPNGRDAEYYAELYKNELKGYPFWGKESQYTSYFNGMFTRVIRGLEFLKAQPEWNRKVLAVFGSSQGGAQALAAAGLDEDVNFIFTCVAAMCDHGGEIRGWPRMVGNDSEGNYDQQVLNASMYFDCVNFARKSKAEAVFTVGFIDSTCRPTTVYAAYNVFGGKKEIINEPLMAHVLKPEHTDYAFQRIVEFAKSFEGK